jgi:hypothetical protein
MTILNTRYNPDYLTPVYNPIQTDNFFTEGTGTTVFYSAAIFFDFATINGLTTGVTFTINGFEIKITTTPTQNQIPYPNQEPEFLSLVRQVINNNPLFDRYDVRIGTVLFPDTAITLYDTIPYSNDVITFDSTNFTAVDFGNTLPDFLYAAQQRANYSIWAEAYTDQKEIFRSNEVLSEPLDIFQTSLYKVYQRDNKYIFNYNNIFQSNSRTTNFDTTNSDNSIYLQKDTNSLNNFRIDFLESYSTTYSGITSIRKFPLQLTASTTSTTISTTASTKGFYWDASRELPFDITPYFVEQYGEFRKISTATGSKFVIRFTYNPVIDEFFYISNSVSGMQFTFAINNDVSVGNQNVRLENTLSGTVENFISGLTATYPGGYSISTTIRGYSQVIVELIPTSGFYNLTFSNSDHVTIIESIPRITRNILNLTGYTADANTKINFLTNRPRTNNTLYYDFNLNGYDIYKKQLSLSMFLSTLKKDIELLTDVLDSTYFNLEYTSYNNEIWNPDWTASPNQVFNREGLDNGLYHINIDPFLFTHSFNDEKFKVKITQTIVSSGVAFKRDYSEEFEFDVKELCDYQILKEFVFLNDLGGWDYLNIIENKKTEVSRTQTLINNNTNVINDETTVNELNFENTISNNYKLSYISSSQDEYNWLYQFIKSSRVYLIKTKDILEVEPDVKLIPVIITASDYSLEENNKNLVLNFDYTIKIEDKSQKNV